MQFPALPEAVQIPGHTCYIAGRYRDGLLSDHWTDVRRCAPLTFTAYLPACTCGWTGTPHPITDTTWHHCRRAWRREHIAPLLTRAAPTHDPVAAPA